MDEDDGQLRDYELYLRMKGFAEATIRSYLYAARYFLQNYPCVDRESLISYRDCLMETRKYSTVDVRVHAINCYLGFLGRSDLKLASVRVHHERQLDNLISYDQYLHFKWYLRESGYLRDYNAVHIIATTGMRVSELVGLEVGDLWDGYADVVCKGRARRVHIPDTTVLEALEWLDSEGRESGPVFVNRFGNRIKASGLADQFKQRAKECGINPKLVYPHGFRHLFSRCFLQAGGDLVLLKDILGHARIQTTSIYLQRTSQEQHDEINRLVSW